MPTGACGINCDVCRLHVMGICSTYGSPLTEVGCAKLAAQRLKFGDGCPVLECCEEKQKSYCLRDCDDFPCANFSESEYPLV